MEWWKILSLVVAGIYIISAIIYFTGDNSDEEITHKDIYNAVVGMFLWLLVSLGCIFYGEELSDGLVGAKFGMISQASPGWAVAFMGWVFLLLPGIFLIFF